MPIRSYVIVTSRSKQRLASDQSCCKPSIPCVGWHDGRDLYHGRSGEPRMGGSAIQGSQYILQAGDSTIKYFKFRGIDAPGWCQIMFCKENE